MDEIPTGQKKEKTMTQIQPNNIVTTPSELTDELLRDTRGTKTNLLVGIGGIGTYISILNPASAEAALKRYEEATGGPATDSDRVIAIGFDDVFQAYEFDLLER